MTDDEVGELVLRLPPLAPMEVVVIAIDPDRRPPVVGTFAAGLDGGWVASGHLAVVAGSLCIGTLRFDFGYEPYEGDDRRMVPRPPPPGGVTSTVVRRFRVSDVLQEARRIFRDAAAAAAKAGVPPEDVAMLERARVAVSHEPPKKRGRTGRAPEFYRQVAVEYLDLYQQGHGRGLLYELAERRGISRNQARDWKRRAVELGFLTPGTPGRAGAEPGPRLMEPLTNEETP